MSAASDITRRYAPVIVGVAGLAGLFMLFSPQKSEQVEHRELSDQRRGDEKNLSTEMGSKSEATSVGQFDDQAAIPGLAKIWTAKSLQVLEYLRESTERDRFDEDYFAELMIGTLPSLAAEERVRLLQEAGRWFAVHAENRAHGLLNKFLTVRDRAQFASGMVEKMLASDPNRAADWAKDVSDEYVAAILHNQIARSWARNDLSAAMQWVQNLPEDRYRVDAIEGLVFTWSQVDMDAAFDWVLEMDHSEIQNRALSKMVKVLSATNPESAVKWAVQLPESSPASESLSYAVQAWARRDLDASVDWLQSLDDPKILETVIRAVPMGWSDSEPAAAANWVMAWEGVEEQSKVLRSVIARWGASNPVDAIDWLEHFPGNDMALRDGMVTELFEKVASGKPSQASSLLEALDSEELKMIARKAIRTTLTEDETD